MVSPYNQVHSEPRFVARVFEVVVVACREVLAVDTHASLFVEDIPDSSRSCCISCCSNPQQIVLWKPQSQALNS